MEQIKRKSFFGAVNLTASVLAAALISGLFTGCPPEIKHIKYGTYEIQHLKQNSLNNEYFLVDVEYKTGKLGENIITLMPDLNGGSTSTELETDKYGKKFLKGRFYSRIKVTDPIKDGYFFTGWNPELPTTFSAVSPAVTYTAKWDKCVITIKGDERTDIPEGSFIETRPCNRVLYFGEHTLLKDFIMSCEIGETLKDLFIY